MTGPMMDQMVALSSWRAEGISIGGAAGSRDNPGE
jgi:hypothetical protein